MNFAINVASHLAFNPVVGSILGTVGGLGARLANRIGAREIVGSARPVIIKVAEQAAEKFEAVKEAAGSEFIKEAGENFVQKTADVMNSNALQEMISSSRASLNALSADYVPPSGALVVQMTDSAKLALLGGVKESLQAVVDAAQNIPADATEEVRMAAQQAALSAREALELLVGDDVTAEAIEKILASLDTVNQSIGDVQAALAGVQAALVGVKDEAVAMAFSQIQNFKDAFAYAKAQIFNAKESVLDVCETNSLKTAYKTIPSSLAVTAALISCFETDIDADGVKQPGHAQAVARTVVYTVVMACPWIIEATGILPPALTNFGELARGMLQGATVYSAYKACKLGNFTEGSNVMKTVGVVTTIASGLYFFGTTHLCQTTADTMSQVATGAIAIALVAVAVPIAAKVVKFLGRVELAPEKKDQ